MYEEIKRIFMRHGLYLLIDDDLEVDDIITDIVFEINKGIQ